MRRLEVERFHRETVNFERTYNRGKRHGRRKTRWRPARRPGRSTRWPARRPGWTTRWPGWSAGRRPGWTTRWPGGSTRRPGWSTRRRRPAGKVINEPARGEPSLLTASCPENEYLFIYTSSD